MSYTSHKLLKMILGKEHLSNCPKKLTLPEECLCWKTEVKKWDRETKLKNSNRIRKSRPIKIHDFHQKCSIKNPRQTSFSTLQVTCNLCRHNIIKNIIKHHPQQTHDSWGNPIIKLTNKGKV